MLQALEFRALPDILRPMEKRSDKPNEVSSPLPERSATLPGQGPAAKRRTHGMPEEIGGPEGPEPTRYGDWERKGRCIDF
jgi:hypothetical protein